MAKKKARQKPSSAAESDPPAAKKSGKKKRKDEPWTEPTAAQSVRDYLKAHPKASNGQIVAALSKQGIVVDDYLPAAIRNENTEAGRRRRAAKTRPPKFASDPTALYYAAPVNQHSLHDVVGLKTHSRVIKNIRILIAKLDRTIEILDALKDDDWEITMLPEESELLFSAKHSMANTGPLVRARIAKLGIKPNEVVLRAET